MSLLGFDGDEPEHAPPTAGFGRRRRPPRSRWRGVVATLVALAVVVALGVVVYRVASGVVDRTTAAAGPSDYTGSGTTAVRVTVPDGASTRTIARTLQDAGVVADVGSFLTAAAGDPDAGSIRPGTYALKERMSNAAALAALTDPASLVGQVSVPEGLTLPATLALLADRSGVPLARWQSAAAALPRTRLAQYRAGTAEGFLFPSTYDVQPTTPPAQVLGEMVDRFDAAAASVDLDTRARALGRTPYQLVTIASLVQAEVANPADQAKVSRVLYNRLQAGMRLQLDSTVHYVTGRKGSVFTTAAERAVQSPYNTYRVAGLPPTPIDSPDEASLQAAADPAPGPWLYYVTVDLDTGETLFATTAAEQQANTKKLQAWCAANPGRC